LNPGPHEYEIGVIATRMLRPVSKYFSGHFVYRRLQLIFFL